MQSQRTAKGESNSQLPLWNDIRIPLEYLEHFKARRECLNCGAELNHELHAYNHWKKYHTQKAAPEFKIFKGQRFYVWLNGAWSQCGFLSFLYARTLRMPTAFTKRRTKSESQGRA